MSIGFLNLYILAQNNRNNLCNISNLSHNFYHFLNAPLFTCAAARFPFCFLRFRVIIVLHGISCLQSCCMEFKKEILSDAKKTGTSLKTREIPANKKSARRDSNPRPPPWQGGAPPLSHSRISERVMGIEPTYPAWKAGVLPLNYTRRHMNLSKRKCPEPESNQ